MTTLRQRMLEDMRVRNLSPKTQQIYIGLVARFARHFGKSPELLGPEEVRAFQVHLVERQLSRSLLIQTVAALRFLYRVTLGKQWPLQAIPYPKRERKLPIVLSPGEVARFFEAVDSSKYRALLMTAYAAGLRISEVLRLTASDIDSQRMLIRIRQGKGSKDRYVMLSTRLLAILRRYWKSHRAGVSLGRKDRAVAALKRYVGLPWVSTCGREPAEWRLKELTSGKEAARVFWQERRRHAESLASPARGRRECDPHWGALMDRHGARRERKD